jgi:hypothetical protein
MTYPNKVNKVRAVITPEQALKREDKERKHLVKRVERYLRTNNTKGAKKLMGRLES